MSEFSAAPHALGWLHQLRCALLMLLDHEEAEVLIEGLDDIELSDGSGGQHLIQIKHKAPDTKLSDYSVDLWKTLRIWATHVSANNVAADQTTFNLVTTANAPLGSAASDLGWPTRNPGAAAIKLTKAALSSDSSTLAPAFQAFLDLSVHERAALVEKIYVLDGSANIDDARQAIEKRLAPAVAREHRAALTDRVEGWWLRRVIAHLQHKTKTLSGFELFDAISNFAEQFRHDSLPIDFLQSKPTEAEGQSLESRLFVQQLASLGIDPRRVQYAILDYYRAFAQRSLWVRDKLLVGNELEQYETKLETEWDRMRLILEERLPQQAAKEHLQNMGRELLNWMEVVADFRIREKVTEPYVMRGSYHMLADEMPPRVWWHPQFMEQMQAALEPRE